MDAIVSVGLETKQKSDRNSYVTSNCSKQGTFEVQPSFSLLGLLAYIVMRLVFLEQGLNYGLRREMIPVGN